MNIKIIYIFAANDTSYYTSVIHSCITVECRESTWQQTVPRASSNSRYSESAESRTMPATKQSSFLENAQDWINDRSFHHPALWLSQQPHIPPAAPRALHQLPQNLFSQRHHDRMDRSLKEPLEFRPRIRHFEQPREI